MKVMYNLEVAQDHTFTVGIGQWVVHNECGPFPNTKPESLTQELDTAQRVGATPLQVGDPGFDAAINSGERVKWAVTLDGELYVIPEYVKGEEISHAVLTGGDPVLGAGRANIAGSDGQYILLEIDHYSGHYIPDACCEAIGKAAFEKNGIIYYGG
jgi:hypothetical protein